MTLILSASDFLYENNGFVIPTLSGTARLHADIDSAAKGYNSGSSGFPPSSSYCREYAIADQAPTSDLVFVTVSSSVEGGAYSGSTGDNAISVRAWVRKDGAGGGASIKIFCKNTANDGTAPHAYYLDYANNGSTPVIRLIAKKGAAAGVTYATISPFAVNEWHRIRLDYIPVAGMKDVISFYTSSAGGTNTETWEHVHTEEILSIDTNYITASTPTNIGYALEGYTNTDTAYIDDFDVYVTPAGS